MMYESDPDISMSQTSMEIIMIYIKLKFLEPFAIISLISALMSIHNVKLMSKFLGALSRR